jgi:hypothetical protein
VAIDKSRIAAAMVVVLGPIIEVIALVIWPQERLVESSELAGLAD